MRLGLDFSIDPVSEKLDDIDVSDQGFAGLGLAQGGFLIAAGTRRNVVRSLQDNPLDLISVRLDVDAHSTRIRYPDVLGAVRQRVVQVRPRLQFDTAQIDRIRRALADQNPDVILVDGELSTQGDDLSWAAVISADGNLPTIVTMAIDYDATGPVWSGPEAVPDLGSVARDSTRLYAARPDRAFIRAVTDPASWGRQLHFSTDGTGFPAPLESLPELGLSLLAEPTADQPRHVNTLVWRAEDRAIVKSGELLMPEHDYVLGIGIGPHDEDSLLVGETSFPDEVLQLGRTRRISIFVYSVNLAARSQEKYLYLPERGASFTCPAADKVTATTDWMAFDHHECASQHRDMAEFAVPRRPGRGEIKLDALVYVGAAAVHKQHIDLSVEAGKGATATVDYRLVHSFDKLPQLTDRVASIDVGRDLLTINALGATGTFSFYFSDTNWSPATARVRETLTDMFFKSHKGKFKARYPDAKVPPSDFRSLLLRLATVGRELFTMIFDTPRSGTLAPLLRNEAVARGTPPVVQIARTLDRPFVVPWQILYDFPMEHPDRGLYTCPSVHDFGPGGAGTWPPPATCPYANDHARKHAVLCPWGFWGLAHLIEVPEPPKERSLDHFVTIEPAQAAVLAGTGAGLNDQQLTAHLGQLAQRVIGFPAPSKGVVTAAADLGEALRPATMDVVYLISHAERSGVLDLGSALVFPDGRLESKDVSAWTTGSWPPDHWSGRRPLVVLNACYTAEIVQSMLGGFVTHFVNGGAAGVVGTETLIDQVTASRAMEEFLAEFSGGATVGEAIRAMRWRLLALGNLLGFCYTPYCAASLRLRPAT